MFELEILLANILAPTAIMLAVIALAYFLPRPRQDTSRPSGLDEQSKHDEAGKRPAKSADEEVTLESAEDGLSGLEGSRELVSIKNFSLSSATITIGAILAIWTAYGLRNDFEWWPEDAWQRVPQASGIVGIAYLLTLFLPTGLAWILRVGAMGLGFYCIYPFGEGWEFLLETQTAWFGVTLFSGAVAWWVMDRKSPGGACVLAFAHIACVAATAFLVAQSFLRATEPMLAISSVLGCGGLAAWLLKRSSYFSATAGPVLMAFAAATASGQFNSFLGIPDRLSWLAIGSPMLVSLAGIPWRHQRETSWSRLLPLVVACILVGVIVSWTWQAAGLGASESW